ncbi:aminotransferase class I/II-fold pyridoxal phosphate-dependent enzyme [Rummeliibacillus sp. POC4]|uniref:aminotransferase class I/II-fold pyridoxal phosphate-dependent enzyme n=1 Tax=Rummeliibacillus sp. POC4 TaxID=2305899 RepID=UPI000E66D94A|nr:aminotransferase class I/II-fold pyridoxal phosphate-dependent enzyme [Rummeliibacillus sp. POC4]RIJ68824.1 aminotransferase class I/II-fold pyridoxal phosphate-dependent enzyme [Rummeliibacillus sp. POC4]
MDQLQTPLFDALEKFNKLTKVSYHVPGHKNGQVFLKRGSELYNSVLSVDATELTGLDDLHAPEGPIFEAEALLADLYHAKKSYFLVNGSTVGNLAMILATCTDGDTVIVQRNCHKSILHGLMLANVKPVFITPSYEEKWGIASGIDAKVVRDALTLYPETKAIILTYPNYYGFAGDLSEIVTLAHERDIPLLVDEAHGAHFILGDSFPNSALTFGADLVVQSAHKTLPAMTMGSYLHANSSLIDVQKVEFYLQMLQSSSPSYPIMGSLDLARAYLASYTKIDQQLLIKKIALFKESLATIQEIELLAPSAQFNADPLKVTIQSKKGISGFELQSLLEEKGIYTELADARNVLFVLPLLKKDADYPFRQTVDLIENAVKGQVGSNIEFPIDKNSNKITALSMSYAKMKQTITKQVSFYEAIGKISSEMVIPYPPGIPLIMAGELITEDKINSLMNLLALHGHFHGGTFLKEGKLIVYHES